MASSYPPTSPPTRQRILLPPRLLLVQWQQVFTWGIRKVIPLPPLLLWGNSGAAFRDGHTFHQRNILDHLPHRIMDELVPPFPVVIFVTIYDNPCGEGGLEVVVINTPPPVQWKHQGGYGNHCRNGYDLVEVVVINTPPPSSMETSRGVWESLVVPTMGASKTDAEMKSVATSLKYAE